jgi:hypothetical protein
VSSILFVGINTKFEIFRVILIKYSLSLGTRGERKASDRKRKRHNKMLGNARHKGNGFSCIECSVLFTTPCEKAISIIPRNFIVDGVALCEMCTSSGPSQKVTDRRDWSHVDVGEELEYGENAPEIASERMAIHIGGHEKQSRLHPTLRGPKGGGAKPDDCPWKGDGSWTRDKANLTMYIFIRGWQNTLRGKIESLTRAGKPLNIPVAYHSVSLNKRTLGWISKVVGDSFTISRYPTKEEVLKNEQKGLSYKNIAILHRSGIKFEDMWPPESLVDGIIEAPQKCNGRCGLLHTEVTLGSKVGWGSHPTHGGINHFCISCLPSHSIPEMAGDTHHIGFCKSRYCGCWTCSQSDKREENFTLCGGCNKSSCNGWIDRKTGEDTWYCRECWTDYYSIHKLVRICDVDKTTPKDEEYEPNRFDGIWVLKDEPLHSVPREKYEEVKRFLNRDFRLEPHMYIEHTEGEVPASSRALSAPAMRSRLLGESQDHYIIFPEPTSPLPSARDIMEGLKKNSEDCKRSIASSKPLDEDWPAL